MFWVSGFHQALSSESSMVMRAEKKSSLLSVLRTARGTYSVERTLSHSKWLDLVSSPSSSSGQGTSSASVRAPVLGTPEVATTLNYRKSQNKWLLFNVFFNTGGEKNQIEDSPVLLGSSAIHRPRKFVHYRVLVYMDFSLWAHFFNVSIVFWRDK